MHARSVTTPQRPVQNDLSLSDIHPVSSRLGGLQCHLALSQRLPAPARKASQQRAPRARGSASALLVLRPVPQRQHRVHAALVDGAQAQQEGHARHDRALPPPPNGGHSDHGGATRDHASVARDDNAAEVDHVACDVARAQEDVTACHGKTDQRRARQATRGSALEGLEARVELTGGVAHRWQYSGRRRRNGDQSR